MDTTASEKSSTGLEPNVAALLSYILIVGIIFLVLEKESKFVKFHATQSVALLVAWVACWMAVLVVSSVPLLGWLIGGLAWVVLSVVFLVAWIICLIKSYQGEWYRLPILGDFSAKQAGV